jgi:hypothetical protein
MSVSRTEVLLSVQRALLGEITPGMRAVRVEWNERLICIRIFHDGPWAQEIEEDFDAGAVTQVVADFPCTEKGDPAVEFQFVRLDAGMPLPQGLTGALVYARNEEKWHRPTSRWT